MIPVEKLDVYKLSENLADLIWSDFDLWDEKVRRTIGYQIIRSADRISANISEGFGRFTPKDRAKFYLYARSFEETKAWLRKLIRRKILSQTQINEYEKLINEIGPKLNAFITKTRGMPE